MKITAFLICALFATLIAKSQTNPDNSITEISTIPSKGYMLLEIITKSFPL
ncbi:hypothetical protein Solca_0710 [Solitalea canadensis DSM 3403]|uniref:Uncharacterized protein n=1 Tax=Solitalea canadensis (strain ATCC 29591 / DSM 3403 / JCM 21819 / LMG 8368 / NBRC 15130 / NCIMB 12057 / USAM 9D) TaxID=929556 RepID=H8KPD7_SOLCM|nr:hypothetical protein Solca_0710 [Solitalea canadensis DSM 3403]